MGVCNCEECNCKEEVAKLTEVEVWRNRWNNGDVKFVPEALDRIERLERRLDFARQIIGSKELELAKLTGKPQGVHFSEL